MDQAFYSRSLSSLKGSLTRTKNRFINRKNNCTIVELNLYLDGIRGLCDKFRDSLCHLEGLDNNEADKYSLDEFEDSVMEFQVEILELIKSNSVQDDVVAVAPETDHSSPSINPLTVPLQMPKIKVPKFNGEFHNWVGFKQLFEVMVHDNKNISIIYKFHYLRESLINGDAFSFIDGMQFTEENYHEVWKNLLNYYDNEDRTKEVHMSNLYYLRPLTDASDIKAHREFINNVNKQYNSLKSLGVPIEHWDVFLVFHITNNVYSELQEEILIQKCSNKQMTYSNIMEILNNKTKLLESMASTSSSLKIPQNSISKNPNLSKGNSCRKDLQDLTNDRNNQYRFQKINKNIDSFNVRQNLVSTNSNCIFCNEGHEIFNCQKFKQLLWTEKFNWVKTKKICINCLQGHLPKPCKSRGCKICHRFHHTILHCNNPNPNSKSGEKIENKDGNKSYQKPTSNLVAETDLSECQSLDCKKPTLNANSNAIPYVNLYTGSQILLSTAVIVVEDQKGNRLLCRALLDQGSMSNFITNSFCQKLKATRERVNIPIVGINGKTSTISFQINLTILSRVSEFKADLDFLVLDKFSNLLPTYPIEFKIQEIPSNVKLADPQFHVPHGIDMILGAETFLDIMSSSENKIIFKDLPPFRNTQLGYIICGKANTSTKAKNIPQAINVCCDVNQLYKMVQNLWQIESVNLENSFSIEEKNCENHFVNNFRRNENGRYSVALPTKSNLNEIGDTYSTALRQFLQQENRLSKNNELRLEYVKFMDEYISLNHMAPVEFNPTDSNIVYFLPHHAVFKENSTTTKVRIVFNASSKSSTGISLNDVLMTGPTIQDDLFSLLLRFRQHETALVADITKMYRQILIHEEDRKLQQIIWRTSPNLPLQVYQLNTVTYGMASAPFAAIRTLKQLAIDEGVNFSRASEILIKDFYVDDLISGTNSLENALQIKSELSDLLSKGGFELRKWASNKIEVCDDENSDISEISILGVPWNLREDSFTISMGNFQLGSELSKRTVLSQLAQIFDPMGLCAPIVFVGKLIMKEIWAIPNVKWDNTLNHEISTKWYDYIQQLNQFNYFKIPRCIIGSDKISIEIHGFGDASEIGYGCCVYIRTRCRLDKYYCTLLCAKSRIAPSKKHTIPRLELCAALLLAQLVDKVKSSLNVDVSKVVLWSDSEITLYRVKSSPAKYSTFVANRVSRIQDLSSPESWAHIPSKLNPADLVSRGLMPNDLRNSSLWWSGPAFLTDNTERWPDTFTKSLPKTLTDPEISKPQNFSKVSSHKHFLIENISNYHRLLRITAIILRFINNCKKNKFPEKYRLGPICLEEIDDAKILLIKTVQQSVYADEIKSLKADKNVSNNSNLKKLCPFLDQNDVLRVGGRLKNSSLEADRIHQILLPSTHTFTKLLVRYEHNRNLHAGPQALLNSIRQQFWIVNGRQLCRKVFYHCITCFKHKPRSIEQFMGDLPGERVKPSRPFSIVGVDFCGPFNIRYKVRSNVISKVYICLFICFATKATHLELVTDLSTKAFLAALTRFISRRGRCSDIFSDNATNFLGAKNELANLQRLFNSEIHKHEIIKFCTEEGIKWHYIPPRSPHFGGLWESAIKSAKYHLKRVVGNYTCTEEELSTLATQVEACLNSRPISIMSNDPSDLCPLTPGHFLIGGPINSLPERSVLHLNFNRLDRYQKIQYSLQDFWRRWSHEYLNELQVRHKWLKRTNEIQLGKIVLLKEDNLPSMKWILGRIVELFPGRDDQVRVVAVKTSSGIFKRAINKICILPLAEDDRDNVAWSSDVVEND